MADWNDCQMNENSGIWDSERTVSIYLLALHVGCVNLGYNCRRSTFCRETDWLKDIHCVISNIFRKNQHCFIKTSSLFIHSFGSSIPLTILVGVQFKTSILMDCKGSNWGYFTCYASNLNRKWKILKVSPSSYNNYFFRKIFKLDTNLQNIQNMQLLQNVANSCNFWEAINSTIPTFCWKNRTRSEKVGTF